MASEGHPIQLAVRFLNVSESGYYDWRSRGPSGRDVRHAWPIDQIQAVHSIISKGAYGARRFHAELTLGLGIPVGHTAVEMLMRRAGLQGLPGNLHRRRATSSGSPTSPNTTPAKASAGVG